MLATFLITIFRDLTEGILVGVVLGASSSPCAWRGWWR